MTARITLSYFAVHIGLTAGQLGWLNCAMSIAAFFSALIVGNLMAYAGVRSLLFISLLGVCCCIAGTSLAADFPSMLFVRILTGIFAGPLYTLLTCAVRRSSSAERYAANIGLITLGEAVISGIFWPFLVVRIMKVMDWQGANIVLTAPIALFLILWSRFPLKEEPEKTGKEEKVHVPIWKLIRNRNILLCCIYGTFCMLTALTIYSYAPMYWLYAGGLSESAMGSRMTGMGIFMAVFSLALPFLSEKKGRKAVLIPSSIVAAVTLLVLYLVPQSGAASGMFVLFGGLPSILPLFAMAVISVESVPEELGAPAVALVNGTCELLGSALGPVLGGLAADAWSTAAVMLLGTVCMTVCIFAACLMTETKSGKAVREVKSSILS